MIEPSISGIVPERQSEYQKEPNEDWDIGESDFGGVEVPTTEYDRVRAE